MFNYQQKVKGMLRLSNPSLPAPLPFLSSPSAFKGHGWPSLASNSRVQVNRQYLSIPDAEHLKAEDRQQPKDIDPF